MESIMYEWAQIKQIIFIKYNIIVFIFGAPSTQQIQTY